MQDQIKSTQIISTDTNKDQFRNFLSPCLKNPSICVAEWFCMVTDNTKNESAKAASLSDCNKLVGQRVQ